MARPLPAGPDDGRDLPSRARTWLVKAWSGEAGQVVQVVLEDTTGRVTEAWTGPQVAWKMARGGEGASAGRRS